MIRAAWDHLRHEVYDILSSDARLLGLARRGAPFLVVSALLVLAIQLSPGDDWRRDRSGAITGHDLSQVWVAGRTTLTGRAAEVYDIPRHDAEMVQTFGSDSALFGWHYPPVYLLPAALLASLPYLTAVALWAAFSLGSLVAALWAATRRADAVLIATAHPLVFCAVGYGQNSLLTAALLTGGLTLLDRRPMGAGILFGLVCYKPQLAALAPLLCLVTGRWECLIASVVTIILLAAASLAAFGVEAWLAFAASVPVTNLFILRDAASGLELNASAFGAVRLLGGSMATAWVVQMPVAAAAIAASIVVWRRIDDVRLRAAVTLMAAPLVSPYVPVYDLATLVPGTCLLVLAAAARGGLTGAERTFLVVSFLLTPVLRNAVELTGIPLGFGLAVAGFAASAGRALGPSPVPAEPALYAASTSPAA